MLRSLSRRGNEAAAAAAARPLLKLRFKFILLIGDILSKKSWGLVILRFYWLLILLLINIALVWLLLLIKSMCQGVELGIFEFLFCLELLICCCNNYDDVDCVAWALAFANKASISSICAKNCASIDWTWVSKVDYIVAFFSRYSSDFAWIYSIFYVHWRDRDYIYAC